MAVVEDSTRIQPVARIDWSNPARQLFLALFMPVLLALGADVMFGSLPLLTMAASIICIPISTVLVVRSILLDFERVIEIVAPEPPATGDDEVTASASETGELRPDAGA
jgi:hypothetical protein